MKTCVLCGGDVENSPRLKDTKGRYMHRVCYERALAERSGKPDAGAAATRAGSAIACPTCSAPLAATAMLCTACGFNLTSGTRVGTVVETADPSLPSAYPHGYSEAEKLRFGTHSLRGEHAGAVLVLAISFLLSLVILHETTGADAAIVYAVVAAINGPLTVVAVFLCTLIWLQIGRPWPLTILRLLAAVAAVGLVHIGVSTLLPNMPFVFFTIFFANMLMMSWALEVELSEAALVAVVTFVIKWLLAALMAPLISALITGVI